MTITYNGLTTRLTLLKPGRYQVKMETEAGRAIIGFVERRGRRWFGKACTGDFIVKGDGDRLAEAADALTLNVIECLELEASK